MESSPPPSTIRPFPLPVAIAIVFISNFCILVLELVASRLMAPIIGNSLYTWTSNIGVILLGISLGNYIGGKLADRRASRPLLATQFILSAFASASVLWLVSFMGSPGIDIPVIVGVLFAYTAVFLLPSMILGTISPMVVKLTLTNLEHTGDVVGKIYAAGAAGSIVGAFATGFVLISYFGTRAIVWGVAALLLLLGVLILASAGRVRQASLPLLLFVAVTLGTYAAGRLDSPCLRETNYFCIKVEEREGGLRVLVLDRLVHSVNNLDDPTELYYAYEHIYRDVMAALYTTEDAPRVLQLGGGGYTFPRYVEQVYPNSEVTVVEIDPGVTEIAYSEMGLPPTTAILSYNEDARRFMQHLPAGQTYDIILGDAFNDFSIPYHLTTLEFNQMVAEALTPQGVYIANVIDGTELRFLTAYAYTLQQAFAHVYISPTSAGFGELARQTYVVLASHRPLDDLVYAPPLAEQFITQEQWQTHLRAHPPILLTDDYVPVDNLLLPVIEDSGL